MAKYNPVLCGTLPIGIDVDGSDLDIIMEVHDFEVFKWEIISIYGNLNDFVLKEKNIRDTPTIKVNFVFGGFEFELFGQPMLIEQQNAYRHMIIEHYLLLQNPLIRTEIIRLKEQWIKTEPAFAEVFGLEGDPYDAILLLGKEMGVYNKTK